MEKKDKLYMSIYNDYYSSMLTEYQSKLVKMYYDEDLSLIEMADVLGISPQGVRDALKRAENILVECEEKLGLVKKTETVKTILEQLRPVASEEQKTKIDEAMELLNK